MTTKDYCISNYGCWDKVDHNPQHTNLNLNQILKQNDMKYMQSKSNSSMINKSFVWTAAFKTILDKANDKSCYLSLKKDYPWSKPDTGLFGNLGAPKFHEYGNLFDDNQCSKFPYLNASLNKSTLSLTIASYESSIIVGGSDAQNNDGKAAGQSSKKKPVGKTWKGVKSFMGWKDIDATIFGAIEFPRQQENETTEPEIMQFKASQRLHNPDQRASSNGSPSEEEDESIGDVDSLDENVRGELMQEFVLKLIDNDPTHGKTGRGGGWSKPKKEFAAGICQREGIDPGAFLSSITAIRNRMKKREEDDPNNYEFGSDGSVEFSSSESTTHSAQSFSNFRNISVTSLADIPTYYSSNDSLSDALDDEVGLLTARSSPFSDMDEPRSDQQGHGESSVPEALITARSISSAYDREGRIAAASDAGHKPKNDRTSLANVIKKNFGTVHRKLQKEKAKEEVEKQKLGNKILGYMGDFIDGERVKKQLENEQLRKKTKATKKEE